MSEVKFHAFVIEPNDAEYDVMAKRRFSQSSVLAGMVQSVFLDRFASIDEALSEYPQAVFCHPQSRKVAQ